MKKTTTYLTSTLLTSALLLSACGGGGGGTAGPGGGGGYDSVAPVQGVSFETTHNQLAMNEAENKTFDHVNVVDRDEGTPGVQDAHFSGRIRLEGSQQRDDGTTQNGRTIFSFLTGQNSSGEDQYVTNSGGGVTYIEGAYSDQQGRQIVVDEVDVTPSNGQGADYVVARDQNYNQTDGWTTENFVYLPAEGKGYVGMAVMGGEDAAHYQARVGIFGRKTTSEEMARQVGTADYEGQGHGYLGNARGTRTEGEYAGRVTARVQFNQNGDNPTFVTGGNLTSTKDGQSTMSYEIHGGINQDGTFVATPSTSQRSKFDGKVANEVHVGGSLYGPDADSMGYTYTLVGDQPLEEYNGDLRMTGGAVLERVTP